MKAGRSSLGLGIILLVVLLSCDSDRTPTGSSTTPTFSLEAAQMAMYYSGEITPPKGLAFQIDRDLERIRSHPEFPTERIGIWFSMPWHDSILVLIDSDSLAAQYRAGAVPEAQALMQKYPFAIYDQPWGIYAPSWVLMTISGRVHPKRLAEEIAKLPGVIVALPFVPDYTDVYRVVSRVVRDESRGRIRYALLYPSACGGTTHYFEFDRYGRISAQHFPEEPVAECRFPNPHAPDWMKDVYGMYQSVNEDESWVQGCGWWCNQEGKQHVPGICAWRVPSPANKTK